MNIPYSLLADLVALSHGFLVALTLVAIILFFCGRINEKFYTTYMVLWIIGVIGGMIIFHSCPLTLLENHLRALGQEETYQGGYLEHYLHINHNELVPLSIALGAIISISLLRRFTKAKKEVTRDDQTQQT